MSTDSQLRHRPSTRKTRTFLVAAVGILLIFSLGYLARFRLIRLWLAPHTLFVGSFDVRASDSKEYEIGILEGVTLIPGGTSVEIVSRERFHWALEQSSITLGSRLYLSSVSLGKDSSPQSVEFHMVTSEGGNKWIQRFTVAAGGRLRPEVGARSFEKE